MNEQETVTVSIPAPPKGWKIDGYREAKPDEMFYENGTWRQVEYRITFATYPCAIREQSEPEYEEIPVVRESSFLIANGRSVSAWPSYIYFAGAIYEHPNGHRKTIGFTHPIFVRPASQAAIWDWSHAETKCHTHMIRPVAIRRKVAK